MPRAEDMRGIESRTTSDGRTQYRGTVPHPEDRKRKLRGPWTSAFSEAKGWRVKRQAKAAEGLPLIEAAAMPTLEEASKAFIDGARLGLINSPRTREPYAPKTLRGYEQAFRDWINPNLGSRPVDKLHGDEVQLFVDEVASLRAGSTVRNVFHALAALYSYLRPRHRRQLLHDPTDAIILPRPGGARERYAGPDEMALLLAALPHDLAMPYALAFLAGLRKAEVQAFPVDHVDLDEGWLDVAYGLDHVEGFKGPKSYAGVRSIPIFDGLRPYLERQLAIVEARVGTIVPSTDDEPGTLLLPAERGSRFGNRELGTPYSKRVRSHWEDAGLDYIGLHEGRHSFGTAAVRAGYDVKTVQEWMGHAQASTTLDTYAKKRGRVGSSTNLAGRMNRYLLSEGDGAV